MQKDNQTVRDHLWLWAHDAQFYGEGAGLPGIAHITPLEGACYMGIPNVMFIRYYDKPEPPFAQYTVPFKALRSFEWSLFNNINQPHTLGAEQEEVYKLAALRPNMTGVVMDDFVIATDDGALKLTLSPEQLAEAKRRLENIEGRKLDLSVVVYAHQLGLPLTEPLADSDVILFWTWYPAELPALAENLSRVEALFPGKRIKLGCYMWDFSAGKPMPLTLLQQQCASALDWLRAGRLEGIIFLGSNICDLELEAVEWTRKWISEVGDLPLSASEE